MTRPLSLLLLLVVGGCDLFQPGPPDLRVGPEYAFTLRQRCEIIACLDADLRIVVAGDVVASAEALRYPSWADSSDVERAERNAPTLRQLYSRSLVSFRSRDASASYDRTWGDPIHFSITHESGDYRDIYEVTEFEPR